MTSKKTITKEKKSETNESITLGKKIKFHYTGKFETGETFDSSLQRHPLEFEVGKGSIIPGLEKQMLNMKRGDKQIITVLPEEAYGVRQEELVREIPKGPVPEGMILEKGAIIYLKTPDGQPFPATIIDVKDTTIILDFNHPLAGKKLIFDVEIVDIS